MSICDGSRPVGVALVEEQGRHKGFDSNDFLTAVAATGAQVLGRLKTSRRLPVLARLPEGSYLSRIGGVNVRVVEALIAVTCADGSTYTGVYRLVTTLLDYRRYPATALIGLYHERCEHESAYYALRHAILAGRVLRSKDPTGLAQEMWALLTLYQALRTATVAAAESVPGTDPDRASFTVAYQAARDMVTQAAGVVTDTVDQVGVIGRQILTNLLPARRLRVSSRKVKSPISRSHAKQDDGRPSTTQKVTDLAITVHEPVPSPGPGPAPTDTDSTHPQWTINKRPPSQRKPRRSEALTTARAP
jgi:hypothetical protein